MAEKKNPRNLPFVIIKNCDVSHLEYCLQIWSTLTQLQDFVLGLVEPHEVRTDPPLDPEGPSGCDPFPPARTQRTAWCQQQTCWGALDAMSVSLTQMWCSTPHVLDDTDFKGLETRSSTWRQSLVKSLFKDIISLKLGCCSKPGWYHRKVPQCTCLLFKFPSEEA